MKTLDYINVRDAQVHGLVNPTFIMYGNYYSVLLKEEKG